MATRLQFSRTIVFVLMMLVYTRAPLFCDFQRNIHYPIVSFTIATLVPLGVSL